MEMTLREAARYLNDHFETIPPYTAKRLNSWVKTGCAGRKLKARKRVGRWTVTVEALNAFMNPEIHLPAYDPEARRNAKLSQKRTAEMIERYLCPKTYNKKKKNNNKKQENK